MTEAEDPLDGLEARLESHTRAFESLLALTPARDYYGSHAVDGQDPSGQWKRNGKKQTKEQKRMAKKAKLDPRNWRSALDVMMEGGKRKRGDGEEDGDVQEVKQRKGEDDADAAEARRREKAERRKEKRARKKEKSVEKKAKADAKKARKREQELLDTQPESSKTRQVENEDDDSDENAEPVAHPIDLDDMDVSGLVEAAADGEMQDVDDKASHSSSSPTTPVLDSPTFDIGTDHSRASSSSSILPPSTSIEHHNQDSVPHSTQPAPELTPTIDTQALPTTNASTTDPPSGTSSPKLGSILPQIPHEELQRRVQERIEALRAQRKADAPDAKSRSELLDQRRRKEEQRKLAKKAQRQKQKEEEQRRREAELRGSGSPLGRGGAGDVFNASPRPSGSSNYTFSRLAFSDGTAADPALTGLHEPRKQKGPQDPRTALQAAQNKASRIAGYDAGKQAKIGEQDMWKHAAQRAGGERRMQKDDTSLLKKALRRKEKAKAKSADEWKERQEGVQKGQWSKQKKREANLGKRKEEKGGGGKKGGGAGKGKGGKGGAGNKRRPGFEGRFKA